MGIALICVIVLFVLFALWNKVHRRSLFWWGGRAALFWWRGKGGRGS
jgi:hypothetical protein